MLNEWKLIGNSEEKRLSEKVGNCHGAIHSSISVESYISVHSVILHHSLSQSEFTSGTWEEHFKEINFADFKFEIIHHFLKQEHVKSNKKEEPEEGIVIHILRFMEKKIYADG